MNNDVLHFIAPKFLDIFVLVLLGGKTAHFDLSW
jgi:hypothetical protein